MAFSCEMCGSADVVKQEGVFICQSCGTKYSVEEVKKMMGKGTVDVSGSTVRVDNTSRLDNLHTLARRALESSDWDTAHSHYKAILLEDPNSWEAVVFAPYTRRTGERRELYDFGVQMIHGIRQSLELIEKNVPEGDQLKAVRLVARAGENYSNWIARNVEDYLEWHFNNNVTGDVSGWVNTYFVAADIQYTVGSCTDLFFHTIEDEYEELVTKSIQAAIKLLEEYVCSSGFLLGYPKKDAYEKIKKYEEKIKSYDVSYQVREVSSGCYVATCVYGSYDCPQVWTLRRFRDNILASSWFGRGFICLYYAVSPTLVKWFGDTRWFRSMWKAPLDHMVEWLNAHGVESAPYQDRQ